MDKENKTAFVTGGTGLLGNNLVRLLAEGGWRVRALARSPAKAERQLAGVPGVEIIEGDMNDVGSFASALEGAEVLFHTAAHFRDSYKGGDHWPALERINVIGTRALLRAAYTAGIRRMVHTSSVAVLDGPRGAVIDESMSRKLPERDAYYRSKVLSDLEVTRFLRDHPDFFATFVLPGWMHGPGDPGPTSAGQAVIDFMRGKLPGVVPGSAALVDARDVALAHLEASRKGRRGERYLAAGRHITMAELYIQLEQVTGVRAPRRRIPFAVLFAIAAVSEFLARVFGRPALLSLATVRILAQENERSRFNGDKIRRELGITWRPIADTLRDEVEWFAGQGLVPRRALGRFQPGTA